jgi:hypothetical protein
MISGVPSSVKLQMKTIVPPAKRPGMISGSVMRKNRASRCSPGSRRLLHGRVDVGQRRRRVEVQIGYSASACSSTTPP